LGVKAKPKSTRRRKRNRRCNFGGRAVAKQLLKTQRSCGGSGGHQNRGEQFKGRELPVNNKHGEKGGGDESWKRGFPGELTNKTPKLHFEGHGLGSIKFGGGVGPNLQIWPKELN